jgi:Putative esterase
VNAHPRELGSAASPCILANMNRSLPALVLLFSATLSVSISAQSFSVTFSRELSATPLDGRLLLVLSTDPSDEPRNQIDDTPRSQIVFGVTMDGWQPGQPAIVDSSAWGYPVHSLKDLPAGDYFVQAVLNKYETFHRSDGKTVKLHMDQGEGQHWNISPGNLYSKPQKITVKPGGAVTPISLTEVIPPIPTPADTKYIRHIRIQSAVLSRFWGRPMFLSAVVLVPEGFDDHPDAHFPLVIFHDHFVSDFDDFRTTPPDPDLKPNYSERFHLAGYNRIQQQEAYNFYQQWIAPGFPRVLIVKIQHANPFYDDSYAVNSANVGPYGDAIENELVPAIEKQFRGIGQGWARFVYGGSTGGWEALAVQVFYPDHYNGAFAACPDPIDFHAFTNIDLYNDKNAFFLDGAHKRVAQPAMRDYLGRTLITTEEVNRYELALGDHGRSGEQFDIWQAVYGPVGTDGYPAQIFDKVSGDIDRTIANYWREHFDLEAILERDWTKLGAELAGKIHIYVGSDDTYFLNDAVYRMEDFLNSTKNPPYDGEVTYGPRAEHCWNGDPNLPNAYSRLHYNTQYLPKILDRIQKTAPPGADLKSWRY